MTNVPNFFVAHTPSELKQPKGYKLDTDKIQSLNDVLLILKSLNLIVYDNYEHFDEIKHLLKGIED